MVIDTFVENRIEGERFIETYWKRFPGRYFAGDGAKRDVFRHFLAYRNRNHRRERRSYLSGFDCQRNRRRLHRYGISFGSNDTRHFQPYKYDRSAGQNYGERRNASRRAHQWSIRGTPDCYGG